MGRSKADDTQSPAAGAEDTRWSDLLRRRAGLIRRLHLTSPLGIPTMPFDIMPTAGLAAAAYDRLIRFFAEETTPRPSEQQLAAIRDLMEHLEPATRDDLPPALYLSAIPAGCAKSTSIAAFAQTLMDNPDH